MVLIATSSDSALQTDKTASPDYCLSGLKCNIIIYNRAIVIYHVVLVSFL